MKEVKRIVWDVVFWFLGRYFPKAYVDVFFWRNFGKGHKWRTNPQDINEKINWLKFYGDTSQWPLLADKYRVRQYVEEKGLGDTLIPLLGHWDRAEDIDWDSLPNKFVMKTNHGCGDVLLCEDKSKLDIPYWTKTFAKLLKQKYGYAYAEPHYNKIRPCVIAEEMLEGTQDKSVSSSSIIDYKIWASRGEPFSILVCLNRSKGHVELATYDVEWNQHPEVMRAASHNAMYHGEVPRPAALEQLLHVASVLSKDHPVARVDLYEVGGKVYFGEMTLTPASGLLTYYTTEYLKEMGEKCKLDVG